MDCVIAAGGHPQPDDLLYPYTQGKSKAQLDMNGRTMLERVIDALQGSQTIEDIVVVGLGDDQGMSFQRPVHHLPDQGGLISNGIAGLDWIMEHKGGKPHVLFSSADIPVITPAIVDDFIERCQPLNHILYYNFVTQEAMETRFPHSNRTFVKLKGARVAGGDMLVLRADLAYTHRDLFEALAHGRKHAWQLAKVVGFGFLFKFLIQQVGFAEIEAVAARILGEPAKIIVNSHAEIAMDADKPHQVDLLRADIAQREG
ncbi:MAG: NTP transferase domain-containing protein [Ardenticatenaceae bacterium]|nr:nucleotidyltransferase family protein [Anaerolineales bacterium]MCB8920111.1 NTP transferase domain-containing protein [Ardenticatenaceae bacterium]MCB8991804.1 NTP transferase domain-containing protein [Ardenticatenaceae bacterium]